MASRHTDLAPVAVVDRSPIGRGPDSCRGTLSTVFAALVVIALTTAIILRNRVIRGSSGPLTERTPVPSKTFALWGVGATVTERDVQRRWDAARVAPGNDVGRRHEFTAAA